MPLPPTGSESRRDRTAQVADATTVIALLDDDDARQILTALAEPQTAQEIMADCDIPRSTAYRKLDELADAGLVEERIRPSVRGNHASEYARAFDDVRIHIAGDREYEVALQPRARH